MRRRISIVICGMMLMMSLAACGSEAEKDDVTTRYHYTVTTESSNYTTTEKVKRETITISTGEYTVGTDIPAGKYDVDYVSGHYALFSVKKTADSPGASPSIVMGDRTAGDDVQHYSNLNLVNGNVVKIESGNLTVKLTPKD